MQGTLSDSFEFRGINFRDKFHMKVVKTDVILPPKRERKIAIPGRHGRYDYGAENWDERIVRLECDITQKLSRDEVREIAYILSKKGRLYLWDEPDKYYVAEIYNGGEIFDYPKQNIRNFTLEFVCEPFAYREAKVLFFKGSPRIEIDYNGTVAAPCRIEIEAVKDTHLILIGQTKRRK